MSLNNIVRFSVYIASFLIAGYFTFPLLSQAQEEQKLHCLVFADSDGHFAVIRSVYPSTGGNIQTSMPFCDGYAEDVSWFISKGYKIDHVNDWDIFLTR